MAVATLVEETRAEAFSLSSRRPEIDGLRALAVIPVILYHLNVKWVSGGFVGVDVFFVISGYLISSIIFDGLENGTFTLAGFYERRVRRIFPALYAMVGVSTLAAIALLLPIQLQLFGGSAAAMSVFASNFLFWHQAGYFDAISLQKPLLHTWSLAVEEQFYLFFPLLLMLLRKQKRRGVAGVLAALALVSWAFSIWCMRSFPSAAFYLLPGRAWELFLGAVVALGLKRDRPSWHVSNVASAVGAVMILLSVLLFNRNTPFPGTAALLPCAGAALIIFAGIGSPANRHSPLVIRWLSWRPVVFVGLISYSLYLWHWPLIVFSTWYLDRRLTGFEQCLLMIAAFVISVISYYFVERPFRAGSGFIRRRPLFQTAAVVLCAVFLAGIALRQSKGLPGRMDSETVQLASATWDWDRTQDRCFGMPVEKLAREGPCPIGSTTAAPSFLLWGDSHAKMLFTVASQQAAQRDLAGMAAAEPDCPALLGVSRRDRPDLRHCEAFNDILADYASRHPEIHTVVLASRWSLYTSGSNSATRSGLNDGPDIFLADAESREKSPAENLRVFQRGLERTVQRLTRSGKSVVLVADVPEVASLPPESLAKARLFHRATDIRPIASDYAAREKPVLDAFREMERRYQARVISPAKFLCGAQYCEVEADGKSLYMDGDHLSQFGTSKIASVIGQIF